MKIAMFDSKTNDKRFFEQVNSDGKFKIDYFEERLNFKTASLATGYEVVCIFTNDNIDKKTAEILEKNGVKFIALRCAGYNNVDLKNLPKGIRIANVPAYSPYAIAEHAIAMLLTSVRRIHKAYNRTKMFNFDLDDLVGFELHGKTVGVIGTGRIGKKFINICRGFGMNVIAYDKYPDETSKIKYVEKDELFRESDIISIHCPLTNFSKHIINRNSISKMKKGVVIINTSRGGLIDSDALLDGLKSKKIGAACLDVIEGEADVFFHDFSNHIVKDDTLIRLIALPNVIVTSHQAFLTEEALSNIADTTLKNIEEFFRMGKCKNELQR
ncbi:2-hydroxyacid dehydrogenase [Candidatus Saccharibacteria bacterium]|nr:2-hydroxyacid dehydrogenase [Candidatus Saccharibacteria bacterium]